MNGIFRRHDLVRLRHFSESDILLPTLELRESVAKWIGDGLPFVVSRQNADSMHKKGWLALGLTLPERHNCRRISIYAQAGLIEQHTGPLSLQGVVDALPEIKKSADFALDLCEQTGAEAYLYGSFSWQFITGKEYVHAESDLDILFYCRTGTDISGLVTGLSRSERFTPRLDGEVQIPSGWAVAWHELAKVHESGNGERLLAKSLRETRFITTDEFFRVQYFL